MASSSRKVIIAALLGNTAISITKFAAAAITGSSAMISEGIHSLVDTGNQILLLHGLRRAKRPASPEFPFGHGKEIYFWAFVVAILIFAVGAGISMYEGILHILNPKHMSNVRVNYIVLGFAMLFEGLALMFAVKEFNKSRGKRSYLQAVHHGKDPSLFVVLFEDSAAMLGLLIAFAGIFLSQITGDPVFDGFASVLIGVILGGTAIWLAVETKGLLIGESANRNVVDGIRKIVSANPDIEHVNEILTMHMGPDFILVNISVDFRDSIAAGAMEKAIGGLDIKIKSAFPRVKRIFVEAESRRKHEAK